MAAISPIAQDAVVDVRPQLRVIEGEGIAEGRLAWLRRVPRGLMITALAVFVYGEWEAPQRFQV